MTNKLLPQPTRASQQMTRLLRALGLWQTRYDIDSLDNRDPALIERIYRLAHRVLMGYFRAEVRGLERIPEDAALFVANHNGGLVTPDSFIFATALYERFGMKGLPYGLAHEFAATAPILHSILAPLGAVRASHENARRVFEQGGKCLVYPGGDVDNMRPWRHRHRIFFDGRVGFARLAIQNNVPIVPVVACGAHETFIIIDDMKWLARALRLDRLFRLKVMPLTLSIPWGLTLGILPTYFPAPTRILIEALEPMHFERSGPEAAADDAYVHQVADEVHRAMEACMTRLAAERRAR